MSGFYITNSIIKDVEKVNKYLCGRGKDKMICDKVEDFSYIYNILLLKDENEFVFRNDSCIIFLDGVIFNSEDKTFSGMNKYILSLYEKYGVYFTKKLDGEYALCLLDLKKGTIVFSKDVFGTKPLWISNDGGFSISSYKSALIASEKGYIRVEANTTYITDFSGKQIESFVIVEFDINQYKSCYDDWCKVFDISVKKRMLGTDNVGIGLSSGYDSGAIYCSLKKNTDRFLSISFSGKESMDILQERIALHQNAFIYDYNESEFLITLKELYRKCEPFNEKYFELLKDESSTGLGIICKRLLKENSKVYFSGCGPEGIMMKEWNADGQKIYDVDIDRFGGHFPEDLSTVFPWDNFWGGVQALYLEKEEYICGCFGIQATYPLLDPVVVQEYLWLSANLKNKAYKAPIDAYFKSNKFPYRIEKAGFFVRNV